MNKQDRVEVIKSLLEDKFSPEHLEVIDDSAAHIGHAVIHLAGHLLLR